MTKEQYDEYFTKNYKDISLTALKLKNKFDPYVVISNCYTHVLKYINDITDNNMLKSYIVNYIKQCKYWTQGRNIELSETLYNKESELTDNINPLIIKNNNGGATNTSYENKNNYEHIINIESYNYFKNKFLNNVKTQLTKTQYITLKDYLDNKFNGIKELAAYYNISVNVAAKYNKLINIKVKEFKDYLKEHTDEILEQTYSI